MDNDSSDEPERVARGWKGAGAFLQLDSNHGFGAASNAGVAAATGDAVVLLNPDTELTDNGLAELASVALERRELCGPRIINRDGSLQASASGPPVGLWPWLRAAVPAGAGPRWAVARLHPSQLETATEVSWLTGCCIAGPRDVFMTLGPFDPAIHMYGEDMDLGVRARIGGFRVAVRPELCKVVHYGKASPRPSTPIWAGRRGRVTVARSYAAPMGCREWFAWIAERLSVSARARVKSVLGRVLLGAARVPGLRRATPVPTLPDLSVRRPRSTIRDLHSPLVASFLRPGEALSMSRRGRSIKARAGAMVIKEGPRRAIFVAGMHRSGTSATARAIAALGLRLPESPMGRCSRE